MVDYVTPDLCDAYPEVRVLAPMFNSYGGRRSFGGQAVTVRCFEDNSRVKELLATPGQGKVLVVDGAGSRNCALLGDLIAASAVAQGWEGVIINGCVRDVEALAQLDLGVQAIAAMPRKSVRKGVGDVDVAITLGGVTLESGNYVYADRNGVIVADQPLTPPENA